MLFAPEQRLVSMGARIFGALGAATELVDDADGPAANPGSIAALHRAAVESAGSTAADWRPIDEYWKGSDAAAAYRDGLRRLLQEQIGEPGLYVMGETQLGRFASLAVDTVREFGAEPVAVFMVDDPRAVATQEDIPSSATRGLIWLRRMSEAEHATRDIPRSFLPLASLTPDWRSAVKRIGRELGVTWPTRLKDAAATIEDAVASARADDAVSAGDLEDAGMPEWVVTAYSLVGDHKRTNIRENIFAQFDRINAEFDVAVAAAVEMSGEITSNLQEIESVRTELATYRAEFERREHELIEKIDLANADLSMQEVSHQKMRESLDLAEANARALENETIGLREQLIALQTNADLDLKSRQKAEQEIQRASEELNGLRAELEFNARLWQDAKQEAKQLSESANAAKKNEQRLEAEKTQLTRDLELARSFLRDAQAELQRLQGEHDFAQREHHKALAERDELAARIAATEDEIANVRNKLSETQSRLSDSAAQVEARQDEIDRQRQTNKSLVDELAALRTELDTARESQSNGEKVRVDLEQVVTSLRTECERLENARASAERAVSDYEKSNAVLRDAIDKSAIEADRREAKLVREVIVQQENLSALKMEADKRRAEFERDASELRDIADRRSAQIEELQHGLAQVKIEFEQRELDLSEQVLRHERDLEAVRRQLQSERMNAARAQTSMREDINGQILTMRNEGNDLRRLHSNAVEELETERKRVAELDRALDLSGQELKDLRRELDERDKKLRAATANLNVLRAPAEKARQEIGRREGALAAGKELLFRRMTRSLWVLSWRPTEAGDASLKQQARLIRRAGVFLPQWYLENNRDVAAAGRDPLRHYLGFGAAEGRDPHPLFDNEWYKTRHPELVARRLNPLAHYVTEGKDGDPNPLFDGGWYLKHYPDVAASGIVPLRHYYEFGAAEGRDPHPLFDTSWYVQQYPDVAVGGDNPLVHYITRGASEGRAPHPLFDTAWYVEKNTDVADAGDNPLAHFIWHGAEERRDPHPLFDSSWYLEQNPDVAVAHDNPLHHFLTHGGAELRNPHPLFDVGYYCRRYPDVVQSGINPLLHFLRFGAADRLQPHPLFDSGYYIDTHPDIGAANPLVHFIRSGAAGGYSPHPLFDTAFYRARYRDVAASDMNPLEHYLRIGGAQDYDPNPNFQSAWYREQHPDLKYRGITPLEHYLAIGSAAGAATRPASTDESAPAAYASAAGLGGELNELAQAAVVPLALQRLLQMYHGAEDVPRPVCVAYSLLDRFGKREWDAKAVQADRYVSALIAEVTRLARARPEAPIAASIIVPVYNKLIYTLACLYTLLAQPARANYEIIVADDVSTDATQAVLGAIGGAVRHVRPAKNLGFLRNCNAAAKVARGDVIVLLNNDTVILPHWLDELVDTLRADGKIGLTGSKLVNADGTLQEAGGIVWNDGSAWNFGRNDDSSAPEYNYVKDVDYISGAAIALPREVWEKLGGFDEIYAPAYCEDSDLAFRVRAAGLRTVYQPFSALVHHEGVSHGRDVSSGIKAYQARNSRIFTERWKKTLTVESMPNGQDVIHARDRSRGRPRILIVDHYVPQPDRDAGSRTMKDYVRLFVNAGFQVTFWPQNLNFDTAYVHVLQRLGVEVIYGWNKSWPKFDSWLDETGSQIDYVYLIRPSVAKDFIDRLREKSSAKIMFNGTDVHFKRLQMEFELTQSSETKDEMVSVEALEKGIWSKSDTVYYLSDEEVRLVTSEVPGKAARVIPTFLYPSDDLKQTRNHLLAQGIANTKQLLFVGGFRHRPNVDLMLWFVPKVWPLITAAVPQARLVIAGSLPPVEIQALASDNITITGAISDDELIQLYERTQVAIIPLRYGAGVKGKLIEALRYAVPIVTTSIGVQGIPAVRDALVCADEPRQFADCVIDILLHPEKYLAQTVSGLDYVESTSTDAAAIRVLGIDMPELMAGRGH